MKLGSGRLKGKYVAILAADGFEYVELAVPRAALISAGAHVEILSLHGGKIRGMNLTEPTRTVRVDRVIDEASPDAYDALFIPGGFISPDFLRQSREVRQFVREFDASGKPIATICHGPWVLASAEVMAGRRLAAWPGVRDDIVHAGGIWRDEPLVHDRNWVSSRGPHDLPEFVPGMIEHFAAGPMPQLERSAALHDGHSSPPYVEPHSMAVAAARFLPGPTLRTVAAAAAIGTVGALAFSMLRGDRTDRRSGRLALPGSSDRPDREAA